MKIEDKFYPTIGITVHATIVERLTGYNWKIETHVAGPDEIANRESAIFPSKSACTQSLLQEYIRVVGEQFQELNE